MTCPVYYMRIKNVVSAHPGITNVEFNVAWILLDKLVYRNDLTGNPQIPLLHRGWKSFALIKDLSQKFLKFVDFALDTKQGHCLQRKRAYC